MKKIVIIDDSALMRKYLRQILESDGYEVFLARNGEDGLNRIREVSPDAVTLDINMPVMDGLTCLSHIMTEMPLPVLMVSSLTEEGALATFEALQLGAVDYVAKPGGTVSLNILSVEDELLAKVKAAIHSRVRKSKGLSERLRQQRDHSSTSTPSERKTQPTPKKTIIKRKPLDLAQSGTKSIKEGAGIVVIGVSTGGPGTLEKIITNLPGNFSLPILIAQHMPAKFTKVFAKRLNKLTELEVMELERATELEPGQVLIARGDADVKIIRRRNKLLATSIPARSEFIWHPSVEYMVQSVTDHYEPESVICVQLTGMGNDGAKAMAALHHSGAKTIAESEETAVVFGMPKELIALDGADKILPVEKVAQQLVKWVG